ncbi:WD repeat-containing protein wrap73 [Rhizophlyctis rosea]|uniref:WD repeat-containing protein wrap73 n=1 Tax=Rhizophlyctis rosea TaxID=64517 RepID=A0AAD5X921_9FUNG|nr:WD repeat-containing protein wrap73 [Rhizophlyctis rosea]
MDFTELYKQSLNICRFSPNGLYLANVVQFRVVIRDAETLQILHLFTCTDNVQEVLWSPDSELVLCASFKLGNIQIWSLKDEKWTAKIDEGAAGCTTIKWAPDARHLLSFSDFQLRITVWSLVTSDAYYIQYPKYSDRGYCFRSDGRYFALAERRECKDYISVYDCEDWILLKRFAVETTDLDDISWSPDGRFIAVWESCLDVESKIDFIFNDAGLVCLPSRQVRFLNHYTWKPLIEFSHPQTLPHPDIAIFQESDLREIKNSTGLAEWSQAASPRSKIRYERIRPPFTLPIIRPDPDKPNPRMGVGICEFSCDGRFVATRNDNMPNCLWIWNLVELRQMVLISQLQPIKIVRWNPLRPDRLAFCCGNGYVYTWNEITGCQAVELPAVNFQVLNFHWNFDGNSMILLDKDKFCLAFPVNDAEEGVHQVDGDENGFQQYDHA